MAQAPTGAVQSSAGSCSPNVVALGSVTITCVGPELGQTIGEQFSQLLNQLLVGAASQQDVLGRLDELRKFQERTAQEQRLILTELLNGQKQMLAMLMNERPPEPVTRTSQPTLALRAPNDRLPPRLRGSIATRPELADDEIAKMDAAALGYLKQRNWTPEGVKFVRRSSNVYDSHGLTFDEGRSFIDNAFADEIARYQGYTCRTSNPTVDDIVIYRKGGRVTHSGLVIGSRGAVVRIRSKWGSLPEFDHDIDKVPDEYGQPEIWHKCA